MDIVIDFDGTCVTHEFPEIGENIGAEVILKKLTDAGHRLFLNTMRCNINKETLIENLMPINTVKRNYLDEAVEWFKKHNIELSGVNEQNPKAKEWTTSPKIYGQYYIDDAAIGCPLIYNPKVSEKPYVDWLKVVEILTKLGIKIY